VESAAGLCGNPRRVERPGSYAARSSNRTTCQADFVRLAYKSRQQICKDIAARRMLAQDIGHRGQRVRDCQLESPRLHLTRPVFHATDGLAGPRQRSPRCLARGVGRSS